MSFESQFEALNLCYQQRASLSWYIPTWYYIESIRLFIMELRTVNLAVPSMLHIEGKSAQGVSRCGPRGFALQILPSSNLKTPKSFRKHLAPSLCHGT